MKKSALRGGFRLPSTLFLGVLALAGSGLPAARGADSTWTGNTNGNFGLDTNWTNGVPGTTGSTGVKGNDTATFLTSGNQNIYFPGDSYLLGSFQFGSAAGADASSFTFRGATNGTGNTLDPNLELRLAGSGFAGAPAAGGAITVNSGVSTTQTFNVRIALTPGNYTFRNDSTAGGILNFAQQIRSTNTSGSTSTLNLAGTSTSANTISGNIINGPSGAGMILNKTGTGLWVLSGANTYTGGTTFGGGTLRAGSAGTLGSTGTLSFTGGTLQYSAANTTDYSARFSTAAGQAYSVDTNGQNVTYAAALTSNGSSLAKLGAGTLTLSANNTNTGGVTVNGGILNVGGGGTLTLSNATAQINGSNGFNGSSRLAVGDGSAGTLNLGAGSSINLDATNGLAYLSIGRNNGNGVFNMTGGSVNAASSTANGFSIFFVGASGSTGTVNQTGGTVTGAATTIVGADGATGVYNLSNGAVFQSPDGSLPGSHVYVGLNQEATNAATNGTINLGAGGTFAMRTNSYLDIGRTLDDNPNYDGGRGYLVQTGGSAVFAGDFAAFGSVRGGLGQYELSGGTADFQTGTVAFGQGSATTGVLNQSGGTLTAGTGVTFGNAGTGTYNLSGGTATFNGGVSIGAQIGGVGVVNQTGGVLTLAPGSSLSFGNGTGTYNLSGGTLQAGGNSLNTALGTYTFNLGAGTLRVTGSSLTTGLNYNATATGAAFTTVDTNNLNATFSGAVSGAGNLVKAGAGTLTFTANNPFTGTTTVSAGTLAAAREPVPSAARAGSRSTTAAPCCSPARERTSTGSTTPPPSP